MRITRIGLLGLILVFTIAMQSCGGGPTAETNAVAASAVELQLTPYEIESVDLDKNPDYDGKVVQIDAYVIRTGSSTAGEAKFGANFIYVECERGPDDPYVPRLNCYTPIQYSGIDGTNLKIKGRLYKNGILYDCVVVE